MLKRPNTIDHIVLRSYTDVYGPPIESVLTIALVDDVLFLQIAKYDESHTEVKLTNMLEFQVDVWAFKDSLTSLIKDEKRSEKENNK